MVDQIPKSTFIKRATYVGPPVSLGRPKHGDLWPMTWARDGRLYAGIGDATGFAQQDHWILCQSLTVDPVAGKFDGFDVAPEYFTRFGRCGSPTTNIKPTGILALDDTLYFFLQDLSPNWKIGAAKDARLLQSPDLGKTWENCGVFFPQVFTTPTFLQAGQNYSDAPDKYAYLYSPKHNWFEEDELFLARVPKGRIHNRASYEFFVGRSNQQWSPDIADMRPVFCCPPKYVQQCEVVFVKPINRYIMVQWRLGTPRYNPANDHHSELYLLESACPTGPWCLFHYDKQWGVNVLDYRYCGRIPANLIAPDGLRFFLQYSGWNSAHEPEGTPYNFNLQEVRLEL